MAKPKDLTYCAQYVPALMNLLNDGQIWFQRDINHALKLPGWNNPRGKHPGWYAHDTCLLAEQMGLIQSLPKHGKFNRWIKV